MNRAAIVAFWSSAIVIVWVYAGYPLFLTALALLHPRPRRRAPIVPPISVIVAAHNEGRIIADKVANVRASDYSPETLEIVVASDGSEDDTVACARRAGATLVLDLPRVGKLRALNAAVARTTGDILVFTDADSVLLPDTLSQLVSNFADDHVGAVAANEQHLVDATGGIGRGEGLYWRYEQQIKRLEDRVGSAVSASGRLYALRRELFQPSNLTTGTDDFVVSTLAIRAGRRLAFDEHARVLVTTPDDGATELRRKVRVMNRGLRAAMSLASSLSLASRGPYIAQLICHKILRRLVAFALLALFASSLFGAVTRGGVWWVAVGSQTAFYALAVAGAVADHRGRPVAKFLSIPYYFCLSNLAAAIAVVSLVVGTKYERWEPDQTRRVATNPEPGT